MFEFFIMDVLFSSAFLPFGLHAKLRPKLPILNLRKTAFFLEIAKELIKACALLLPFSFASFCVFSLKSFGFRFWGAYLCADIDPFGLRCLKKAPFWKRLDISHVQETQFTISSDIFFCFKNTSLCWILLPSQVFPSFKSSGAQRLTSTIIAADRVCSALEFLAYIMKVLKFAIAGPQSSAACDKIITCWIIRICGGASNTKWMIFNVAVSFPHLCKLLFRKVLDCS